MPINWMFHVGDEIKRKKMKRSDENNIKGLTLVLSVFALIAICVMIYIYHDENINLQNLSMLKRKGDRNASQYVKCELFSNLGAKDYLMLEMAIPYRDKEQQADLNGKLDQIKSDFLTNINHRNMEIWIQERDYDAIKGELLKVINTHTKQPVANIYFDSLLYQ
jgi:flagellar basal body-associated protein FliL